jgi:23S rRNA (uracil1939-C5)-methyltransferase
MNTEQAEKLYDMVIQKLDACDHLFEGYCGIGTMSLMAKDKARKITGAEFSEQAVTNAKANTEMNRVPNVSFFCADSAEAFHHARKSREIDCVLVDPPRSGLDDNMVSALLHSKVKRIIYVSCNPETLGKNLKELKKAYDVRTIIPYDMFPDTPLVEAICVLERTGGR